MFLIPAKLKTLLKTPFKLLIIILFLNTSCSHEDFTSDPENLNQEDLEMTFEDASPIIYRKNSDQNELNKRFHRLDEVISPEVETLNGAKGTANRNNAGDYTVVAFVENPSVNGFELSGTSVEYSDRHEKIYVTYHANGPEIYGAIEVYDVSDTDNPSIEENDEFENLEFNDVHISVGPSTNRQNALYTAGNTEIDVKSTFSIFHQFDLDNNGLISFPENEENLTSKYVDYGTASSVMKYDSYVFLATAGTNGIIFPMLKDFSSGSRSRIWTTTPGNALKYLDNYRGNMVILTNGSIVLTDVRNNPRNFANNVYWTETFSNFSPSDGKNVVKIDSEKIYIAAGSDGVYQYSYDTNGATLDANIKSFFNSNMAAGIDADDFYVYVANASNLTVFKKSQSNVLYHYNLNIGSINFVKAYKDLLFVAGTDGVKILNKGEEEEEEEEEEDNTIPSSAFEVYNGVPNPNQYRLEAQKSITGGSSKLHIGSQILTPSQTTANKYKYVISSNQLTTSDDIFFGEQTATSAVFQWDGTFSN